MIVVNVLVVVTVTVTTMCWAGDPAATAHVALQLFGGDVAINTPAFVAHWQLVVATAVMPEVLVALVAAVCIPAVSTALAVLIAPYCTPARAASVSAIDV